MFDYATILRVPGAAQREPKASGAPQTRDLGATRRIAAGTLLRFTSRRAGSLCLGGLS
jgi:hypothetical protein